MRNHDKPEQIPGLAQCLPYLTFGTGTPAASSNLTTVASQRTRRRNRRADYTLGTETVIFIRVATATPPRLAGSKRIRLAFAIAS